MIEKQPDEVTLRGLWSLSDMLEIRGSALFSAMQFLNRLSGIIQAQNNFDQIESEEIGDVLAEYVRELDPFIEELTRLEVPLTLMVAERLRHVIVSNQSVSIGTVRGLIEDLSARLPDELAAKMLMVLPDFARRYLTPEAPLFGTHVEAAFPLAAEDISEAASCMVFGRYTAAVFHLMRAMESALQALAKAVGLERTEIEWGEVARGRQR